MTAAYTLPISEIVNDREERVELEKTTIVSRKKTATTATTTKQKGSKICCGVCNSAIVEGWHEAIFCEGECQLWYHRGCTSVHLRIYLTVRSPFLYDV